MTARRLTREAADAPPRSEAIAADPLIGATIAGKYTIVRLLARGGLLMSYSCSGGISSDHFQQIVADAANDAGRNARILRRLAAPSDHPVALHFPEGEYLKGLLCEVD